MKQTGTSRQILTKEVESWWGHGLYGEYKDFCHDRSEPIFCPFYRGPCSGQEIFFVFKSFKHHGLTSNHFTSYSIHICSFIIHELVGLDKEQSI